MLFTPLIWAIVLGASVLVSAVVSVCVYWHGVSIAPLFEKKERLKEEVESLQNKQSELKAELADMNSKRAESQRIIAEGQDMKKFLEENRDTEARLRSQIVSAKELLKTVEDKRRVREEELQKIYQELQTAAGKNQALKIENERLLGDNEARRSELGQLKREIARREEEKTVAEHQSDAAKKELLKLQSDENECRNEIAKLNNEIAAKEHELKTLDDRRAHYQQELDSMQARWAGLESEYRKLVDDVGREKTELRTIEGKAAELKQEMARIQEEKTAAVRQSDAAKKELLKLQGDKDQCQTEIAGLNGEIAARERELQKLTDRSEHYRQELDNVRKQKESIDSEYREIIKKISEKNAELLTIEGTLADRAPASDEIRWGDLNRPVFAIKSSRQALPPEGKWLQKFKKMLTDTDIKFHDRMIHAFHTGLKVADYSPLVVLAGISGTGKSLLPRLYAKALGMNFLQIAVQPRWDNPQDMFGFYNYMEGRYKATELSRMLWQFDVHNNPDAKKYDGKLPMNLVLLDEMNLAKVEYYFSDMLSKLEVRRGLDEKNDSSRRNAEIEIECGSLQKKEQAKRLFVGRNTLFVGTMNEDESTQSLSDKVVDRSNVLRFGRPQDLKVQPKVVDFETAFESAPPMTLETWQSDWLETELKSGYDGRLHNMLDEINVQLAVIGRPFAYRMSDAIRAYVANYPIKGEQGFKDALADQIEMKVLPKLNGVDKESSTKVKDALSKIGEIIDRNVKDEQLLAAFNAANDDRDAIFFQWRGVTR